MQVNEEIDALQTAGISPIDFLVLPRVVALALMMPLLTLYADSWGSWAGWSWRVTGLNLDVIEYYNETRHGVNLTNVGIGVFSGFVFGDSRRDDRMPEGHAVRTKRIGRRDATRSAVVTGIVSIIVATADHYRAVQRAAAFSEEGQVTPGDSDDSHIVVRDLTMAYGSFVLQRDLTFTVNRGDVFIIMGGSGCGKSTLLRHLVGLQRPAGGTSVLRGRELLGCRCRRRRDADR